MPKERKMSASAQAGKISQQPKKTTKSKSSGKKKTTIKIQKPPLVNAEKPTRTVKTTATPKKTTRYPSQKGRQSKLRVMMLGGLGEIGKNMAVIEYGGDMIVVDAGLSFPDEDMLGIDLVIPDISYLEKNVHKIRGILLTHGHEDHIGALPYVLRSIRVPVYATRMTVGILSYKLKEAKLDYNPTIYTVNTGDTVALGCFQAEFVHVNHSIADACAIAIKTPVGTVFHTGDFKLDVSPIDGQLIDLRRLGEIGQEGVLLMLGESTNAERAGFTPSERTVGNSFDQIFLTHKDKRIVIATFSSNVHRVQQIINTSIKFGRKVAVLGRSMVNVLDASVELGYTDLTEGTLIDVSEIRRYKPEQLTLITTGSQGEPMSALYRLAFGEHEKVRLTSSDLVVLSSSAIPGNEKLINKIINALIRGGIQVLHDRAADVHVSGHACSEELKLMLALIKPKYFIPIHGESRHLYAHKEIAEFMGITPDRIFLLDIGQVMEFDGEGAHHAPPVPAGRVMIDGGGIGDVGSVVLRDRRTLSQEGLIEVVAAISESDRSLVTPPEIISRGYVYMRDAEELIEEARYVVAKSIDDCLIRPRIDYAQMKEKIRGDLSKFLFAKNKRSPMILSIILNV